jgi:hypothetical protein
MSRTFYGENRVAVGAMVGQQEYIRVKENNEVVRFTALDFEGDVTLVEIPRHLAVAMGKYLASLDEQGEGK